MVFLLREVQDSDEGDGRGEEWDEPDAEDLGDGDVEDLRVGVVCWGRLGQLLGRNETDASLLPFHACSNRC